MLSDILIIAVIVLFAFLGYKRGLAVTLLNFAAVIATSIISNFLSDGLAKLIYDAFIKQSVVQNIQSTVDTYGVETAVNTSLKSAPDWITGVLKPFMASLGLTLDDVQKTLTVSNDKSLSVAQNLEKPVGELTVGIISFFLSIVIFALVFILFKFLIRKIIKVFELPVIGTVNHILGTFAGLAEGIVLVIIAVNVIYVVIVSASPGAVNNGVFGSLFNWLCFFK